MSCRRARGFESKRTNEPPTECRGCEVQPRVALALRGLSWFIPTSHTQHATCHGSPTAPSRRREVHQTPRCRVQPPAARDGRHGPETRVAGSFVDTNFMSFFRNSDCVTKGATTAQRSVRSNKLMAGRSGLIRPRHLPPGIHMQPQARVANFKLLCDLRFAHGHVGHEKTA